MRQDRLRRQQELAAVGFAGLHWLRANAAVGSGLVVDDDRQCITAAQLVGQQSGSRIGRATRGEADDDARGLVDRGLCLRERREGGSSQRCGRDEVASVQHWCLRWDGAAMACIIAAATIRES